MLSSIEISKLEKELIFNLMFKMKKLTYDAVT